LTTHTPDSHVRPGNFEQSAFALHWSALLSTISEHDAAPAAIAAIAASASPRRTALPRPPRPIIP
jgi:hypothetical protein